MWTSVCPLFSVGSSTVSGIPGHNPGSPSSENEPPSSTSRKAAITGPHRAGEGVWGLMCSCRLSAGLWSSGLAPRVPGPLIPKSCFCFGRLLPPGCGSRPLSSTTAAPLGCLLSSSQNVANIFRLPSSPLPRPLSLWIYAYSFAVLIEGFWKGVEIHLLNAAMLF